MTEAAPPAEEAEKTRAASEAAPSRRLALFDALPDLEANVPWLPLAETPTPVEPCTAIESYLGRSGVFIKRDDRVSSVFGGNKIRRFEFLLADAKARERTELVTAGGLASTQVVATAMFGKKLGFGVTAVLFDQPTTPFTRKALLSAHGAGARLVYGGGYVSTAIGVVRARMQRGTYLIMPGASTPLANLGYVDAMLELGAQVERGEAPRPDVIVLPAGSGGTAAGLAVGASLLGWPIEIIAVRITDLIACNRFTMRFLTGSTRRFLRRRSAEFARSTRALPSVRIHHGEIGRGYGYPTRAAEEAIGEVERLIGVPGEVTYSGKGLAGLRAVAKARPKATILYWQTLSSTWPNLEAVDVGSLPAPFRRFCSSDQGPAG